MALNAEHPQYAEAKPDWELMTDAYKGERHVKSKGVTYLPPTPGMVLDGMVSTNTNPNSPGKVAYEAYKMRAIFPDFVQVGVETLIGVLHAKEATVELPEKMEYLRTKASSRGESLVTLHRRLNENQLTTGRAGLLVDLPANPDPTKPQPYIALYNGQSIINWDDNEFGDNEHKLSLVVLDESGYKRGDDLTWSEENKYRVLRLVKAADGAVYKQGVFEGSNAELVETDLMPPMLRGETLKEIPFYFVNSKDNLAEPDAPPLIGLGRMCFSIYRSEADYRQNLFMQGQDTLVVIGGVQNTTAADPDAPLRVGAGARIDVNMNGDAKYIGVSGDGLEEQRMAIDADKKSAAVRTGQLLAPGKMSMESGEALKTRVAAQTATLTSVALSSTTALLSALRTIALWMREDPSKIKMVPNLDFTNVEIQGQDIVQLITAKNLGFPISYRSLHALAKERGMIKTSFEDEMKEIAEDPELLIKRAQELAQGLKGNNPLEAAGGPKNNPDNKGNGGQGNKPTK